MLRFHDRHLQAIAGALAQEPEENPWGISFMRGIFNMANDSGLFCATPTWITTAGLPTGNVFVRGCERMLPLYEAKMIHHFDHRLASYEKRAER